MGGEREATVPVSSTTQTGEKKIGTVRFHESKPDGEIHFHDDANQMKVAVPTATWYKLWELFSSGQKKKIKFIDAQQGTKLTVKRSSKSSKGKKSLDAEIKIESINVSGTFAALQTFTQG